MTGKSLYLADFTPLTDRNLASWDFFISLKNGIEKMSGMCISADKIANSQKIKSRWNDRFPQRDKLSQKPQRSPQMRMSR
ncbi:hypothetical protein RC54_17600 [Herbaspirillum rubrisubalbicans]|uniref:Uncharacterized protein n=1 Tax=Herbaspirillum rubrisubalbicans TaxID=80842 RepID=A0AAD0XHI1_9BURK|nr:hypothetical protein RC54_17600 [Herbaspirillum rubrisubalbicans]